MRCFTLIWVGQFVSLMGSGLTTFALGVWTYQLTGSATKFALISMFGALPNIVALPLAGVLVDRWERRRVMILSNAGCGLVTLALGALFTSGRVEIWHIYAATAALSVFSAFQLIAYSASVALLVPARHFGRASGIVQTAQAVSQIGAPLIAGALMFSLGIHGLLGIDFLTYIFALLTLAAARIPRPEAREAGGPLLRQTAYGWNYIRERPGLLALLTYFASVNLLMTTARVLFIPMTLSFASPTALATVLSVSSGGLLLGGLLMSAWGGPRRRVAGVFGFGALAGLTILLAGLRPSLLLVGGANFALMLVAPIINGCNQAIWQSKVAADVQGRVFATRQLIGWSLNPLAYAVAGPLADNLFEPLVASAGGPLGEVLRAVVGVGPGRGIALMYVIAGLLCLLIPAVIYLYPRLRRVESELPDAIAEEAVADA
jgi:MFS family permease